MPNKRSQRSYDHRLVRLVQETGDARIATGLGVPRTTAAGWLRRAPRDVTAAPGADNAVAVLRGRVARLELRCRRLPDFQVFARTPAMRDGGGAITARRQEPPSRSE